MAKVRRTIHRLKSQARDVIDDQIWPVNFALFLLGGFLVGVTLAYLRFDDRRWFANAWTALIAVPVVLGTAMLLLHFVANRFVKRTMQLALVLCVVIHLLMLVASLEVEVFGRVWHELLATSKPAERPKPVTIPEYHPRQVDPRNEPRPDFEQPVETATVEPEPAPMQPQEQQQDAVVEVQPMPVPQSLPAINPSLTRQEPPAESVPRQSDQPSMLSRQTRQAEPQLAQPVEAPQVARGEQAAAAVAVPNSMPKERQPSVAVERTSDAEPSTVQPQRASIARNQLRPDAPQTESQATLLRQQPSPPANALPVVIPAAQSPSVARATAPEATAPSVVDVTQPRRTASPQMERSDLDPVPQPVADRAARPQRRQNESAARPTVAETPRPVENRQPRLTTRPEIASAVALEAARPTEATKPGGVEAAETSIRRVSETATHSQPATAEAQAVESPQRIARSMERSREEQPISAATPSPALARQASQVPEIQNQVVETPQTAAASRQPSGELSPQSTATRKQPTEVPQTARRAAEPAAPSGIPESTVAASRSVARAAQRDSRPAMISSSAVTSPARAATARSLPSSNVADNVDVEAATRVAAQPLPSPAEISRQRLTDPAAENHSLQPAETSARTPAALVARSDATRTQPSDVPTVRPDSPATANPRRATRVASAAASPVPVESPASSASERADARPFAEPSSLALSKSTAGTAGVGESQNLERTAAAAETPAVVASGSAPRQRATQDAANGPALSPVSPALISRSRAAAQRPSATLLAEDTPAATSAGSRQPEPLDASASAAITHQNAQAELAAVTAASGAADVDLGPTRIVPEKGDARASGGGQPELNLETQSRNVPRQSAGGARELSIAANNVATVIEAPDAEGGGRPELAQTSPTATAPVRALSGGTQPVSGGPSNLQQSGPSSQENQATRLAQLRMPRAAASADASAGAPAADGQPEPDSPQQALERARSAIGGAPLLAMSAPRMAEMPEPAAGGAAPSQSALAEVASRPDTGDRLSTAAGPTTSAAPGNSSQPDGQPAARQNELLAANRVQRAEAADAPAGDSLTGGGTAEPDRATKAAPLTAIVRADTVTVAALPESSGNPQGAPLPSRTTEIGRSASGIPDQPRNQPSGGPEANPLAVPSPAEQLAGPGSARLSGGRSQGEPSPGDVGESAARLLRRAAVGDLPAGTTLAHLPLPSEASQAPSTQFAQADGDATPMARQSGGAIPVKIEAAEGPGGLGESISVDVGIDSRRASVESTQVQIRSARFLRQQVGGLPSFDTSAVVAAEPFRRRIERAAGDSQGSVGPEIERAIQLGLAFLVRHQLADGSWSLDDSRYGSQSRNGLVPDVSPLLRSNTAATGLALLSFQGAAYTHREGKHQDVVLAGINYLIQNQKANGDLFMPMDSESNAVVQLYSHSIAALALCEAYGMTQDPALRAPAQKALDFIVQSQDPRRGGWRYSPRQSSDTSVTGWMVLALKSGDLANLDVPTEAYAEISRFLDLAQASRSNPHLYRYNPDASDEQAQGRRPTKTMTAVGLLMRLYTGWRRDNQNMIRGAEYLRSNPPAVGSERNPLRDTYYWYYATQLMFHMGGSYWEEWNGRLHPLLVNSQIQDGPMAGSWDPGGNVPDRWGPHAGRLYVSTMNLLSLEVSYRHLPLYEETAR